MTGQRRPQAIPAPTVDATKPLPADLQGYPRAVEILRRIFHLRESLGYLEAEADKLRLDFDRGGPRAAIEERLAARR